MFSGESFLFLRFGFGALFLTDVLVPTRADLAGIVLGAQTFCLNWVSQKNINKRATWETCK